MTRGESSAESFQGLGGVDVLFLWEQGHGEAGVGLAAPKPGRPPETGDGNPANPSARRVWLVGGGSGHGFKHGPALGEYASAKIIEGGETESRFSLATKETVRERAGF